MDILITGGTGFIGKNLINLLSSKYNLIILTRSKNKISTKNINYIYVDLLKHKNWHNKIKRFNIKICIHLAWSGIPNYDYENCLINLKINFNFFNSIKKLNLKKLIITGTCLEYGIERGKLSEYDKINFPNQFAFTKNFIREYAFDTFSNTTTKVIWLRLFYVYGPNQRIGSIIPYIINNIKKNIVPEIKKPEISNDYVFIDDVVEAIFLIIKKNIKTGVYNLGSGKLTNNYDILHKIYKLNKIDIKRKKVKKVGFYANIKKISTILGWLPRTSLSNGLNKTFKYYLDYD